MKRVRFSESGGSWVKAEIYCWVWRGLKYIFRLMPRMRFPGGILVQRRVNEQSSFWRFIVFLGT